MMGAMAGTENPEYPRVHELDSAIAARVVAELGDRAGRRTLSCLRAAAELLRLSHTGTEVRFAESAAYNLREALDSVVRDQPAGEGGLRMVIDAWDKYKQAAEQPEADEPTARSELASVLDGLTRNGERQAYMTRKLLEWLRRQTGVSPLVGDDDPTVRYQRIRESAQEMLHTDASETEVRLLYQDVLAWFERLFAPPSDIARRLAELVL
jgi:hypothetical protein